LPFVQGNIKTGQAEGWERSGSGVVWLEMPIELNRKPGIQTRTIFDAMDPIGVPAHHNKV
jgi:hypothetical protein